MSGSDNTPSLAPRRSLLTVAIWSAIAFRWSPLRTTVASHGYTRSVRLVMGTTCKRFKVRFAALLLTITAGRIFCISPPSDGSKLTHHTSPRSKLANWKRIVDQGFYPLGRFALPVPVEAHLPIGRLQAGLGYDRTRQLLDYLADRTASGRGLKAPIDLIADRDRDLMRHTLSIVWHCVVVDTPREIQRGLDREPQGFQSREKSCALSSMSRKMPRSVPILSVSLLWTGTVVRTSCLAMT